MDLLVNQSLCKRCLTQDVQILWLLCYCTSWGTAHATQIAKEHKPRHVREVHLLIQPRILLFRQIQSINMHNCSASIQTYLKCSFSHLQYSRETLVGHKNCPWKPTEQETAFWKRTWRNELTFELFMCLRFWTCLQWVEVCKTLSRGPSKWNCIQLSPSRSLHRFSVYKGSNTQVINWSHRCISFEFICITQE